MLPPGSPPARTAWHHPPLLLPTHVRTRPSHRPAANGWPPSRPPETRVLRREDPAPSSPWRLSLRDSGAAADDFLPIGCRESASEACETCRQFQYKSWADTCRLEYRKARLSSARN